MESVLKNESETVQDVATKININTKHEEHMTVYLTGLFNYAFHTSLNLVSIHMSAFWVFSKHCTMLSFQFDEYQIYNYSYYEEIIEDVNEKQV